MKYQLEMRFGQTYREVEADSWDDSGGWMVFYRLPPEGGHAQEYWRVRTSDVVSMSAETKR